MAHPVFLRIQNKTRKTLHKEAKPGTFIFPQQCGLLSL